MTATGETGKNLMFPSQLTSGLWMLGHSYFTAYLARGTRMTALIEMGVSATVDAVTAQLRSLEVKPDLLVVMHPHGDHINGLPGLMRAFPAAEVIAGPGAASFIAHPKAAKSLVEEDRFITAFMSSQGVSSSHSPLIEAPTLAGSHTVDDGETIDLGGITLQFLTVRGHAPGSIAVFIPEMKALMPSDSLGYRFSRGGFFPIFFTGYNEYMATISRLESLHPEILGLAHQGALSREAQEPAFAEARRSATGMRERILSDTRPDDDIVADIFKDFYRDELKLYTRENIIGCCRLLIKRSRE
jgi:glyoxylase-like metal-dependent hydrolase (beta-lactamase superfamily II)